MCLGLVALCSFSGGSIMAANETHLPLKVDRWSRLEAPEIFDSKNIFDYMNGGAELYLGYRFQRLEVYEYALSDRDRIVVELYFMATSDDAYGLLSLDWGGGNR